MRRVMERGLSKRFGRACRGVAAAAVAVMVGACSSLPSPTAWIMDERPDALEQGEFRSLATVPEQPEGTGTTATQRREQANQRSDRAKSLVSDRDLARHTREVLRGNDLPPPPSSDPPDQSSDPSDQSSDASDAMTIPGLATSYRPYVRDGEIMSRDGRLRQPVARPRSDISRISGEENQDTRDNSMVSSAPILTAKVAVLDESRLRDTIYLSKLKKSALSQQAALNPKTAEFASSSAPPLPPRALKLATKLSGLTQPNESSRDSAALVGDWSQGRLVRASTSYEQGSRIVTVVGRQDRSRDVLLARINRRSVMRAQDRLVQITEVNELSQEEKVAQVTAEARPEIAADADLRPVTALEIPDTVRRKQPDAVIRVANASGDLAENDLAKLRRIAVAQRMTGATVRLIAHTPRDQGPAFRDEVPLDAQLTRALLIRMLEVGILSKDLRLESNVDYEAVTASDLMDTASLEGRFHIYLDSPADPPRPVS